MFVRLSLFLFSAWLLIAECDADERSPSQKIDALINSNLAEHKLKPNDKIDDGTFLRRAYLSIIGRIPTIEEAESFSQKTAPDPRAELIDELLSSEGYVSHFYNFWADILRMQDDGPSKNAFINYQLWLKKALRENIPYDEMVYSMVSARGKSWENGASGYYHRDRGMPLDNMSNTARIFLGTRLECAQCHNHPFDKWTQMDYYKMAAFSYSIDARDVYTFNPLRIESGQYLKERYREDFAKAVGVENFPFLTPDKVEKHIANHSKNPRDPWLGEGPNAITPDEFRALAKKGWAGAKDAWELQQAAYWAGVQLYKPLLRFSVVDKEDMELELPHDYQYDDAAPHDSVMAATIFGDQIDTGQLDEPAIEAYAKWMTSNENPRFTTVIANRLWKKAFGIGLIEPVDELTDQTVASNPELMNYLEEVMVGVDYDMRAFLAVLFKTDAWQRAVVTEEVFAGIPFHYPGPALERMSAEQIWDSMVALCIPEAERYRPLLKAQLAAIEKEKLTWTSLEDRTLDDYLKMITTVGPMVMKQRNEEARISQEMANARGDDKRIQQLRDELKTITQETNKVVNEIALKDLHRARKGGELLQAMAGVSEMKMTSMMDGQSTNQSAVFTSLPEIKMPPAPEDLDKNQLRAWEKEQRSDLSTFKKLVSKMARASELEAPSPRGHFLRDFGQSDREVIENSSAHASVPQALNLLNGQMIEALTNKFAVFGRRIQAAESEDEKIQIIFQAMLTRKPTDAEMKIARSEVEENGDAAYDSLVWALLNTQQFLFIQ